MYARITWPMKTLLAVIGQNLDMRCYLITGFLATELQTCFPLVSKTIQYTQYTVQCTQYTVQCTLFFLLGNVIDNIYLANVWKAHSYFPHCCLAFIAVVPKNSKKSKYVMHLINGHCTVRCITTKDVFVVRLVRH